MQLTPRAWACIEAGTRLWAAAEADLQAIVGSAAVQTTRGTLERLVSASTAAGDIIPLRPPR